MASKTQERTAIQENQSMEESTNRAREDGNQETREDSNQMTQNDSQENLQADNQSTNEERSTANDEDHQETEETQVQHSTIEPNEPHNDQTNNVAHTDEPIIPDHSSDDENSEFGDDSDITSLSSSILEYQFENGRRYHSSRVGLYMLPNDEDEQDRMDLTHHIWLLLLKGELFEAPVTNPQKILDLGTGTGVWALDVAEKFPGARVIGNDISAIQPDWVFPNVEFIIEDFESEWLYEPNSFDFIHARLLAGCVTDWPAFFMKVFEHVKPGCYFEAQESGFWAWSDDGTVTQESPINQYLSALIQASRSIGREVNVWHKLKDWMIEAGFEDVHQYTYFLPYSPWPLDPHLKELGKYQAVMAQQAVESYGLRLCTQILGWGVEPSRIFQAMAKRNLRDKNAHAYVKMVAVYGRKPLTSY